MKPKTTTKRGRARKKLETRGRPEKPAELRKVNLVCRVPKRIKDGFSARAKAHGTDAQGRKRSSVGLEVERAFDATANPTRSTVSDAELNAQIRRWSHAGLESPH